VSWRNMEDISDAWRFALEVIRGIVRDGYPEDASVEELMVAMEDCIRRESD